MALSTGLLTKLEDMVAPLSNSERLALIQAIITSKNGAGKERSQLEIEQESWFARRASDKENFSGEFVAVHDGKVLDHDADRRALILRTRQSFPDTKMLIVHADWNETPTYTIPRIILE